MPFFSARNDMFAPLTSGMREMEPLRGLTLGNMPKILRKDMQRGPVLAQLNFPPP